MKQHTTIYLVDDRYFVSGANLYVDAWIDNNKVEVVPVIDHAAFRGAINAVLQQCQYFSEYPSAEETYSLPSAILAATKCRSWKALAKKAKVVGIFVEDGNATITPYVGARGGFTLLTNSSITLPLNALEFLKTIETLLGMRPLDKEVD
jgi:hypothetical protein